VTTAARLSVLPDIPTVGDFVPHYEATASFGLGAPKNTPMDAVGRLNAETNIAIADPKVVARFADLNGPPTPMTPTDYGKLIADETR
jgi:tripartite-type tricarboxylate transporter receptor subunit TctC